MSRNPMARHLADARNRRRIITDKRADLDQREAEKRLRQMQHEEDDIKQPWRTYE